MQTTADLVISTEVELEQAKKRKATAIAERTAILAKVTADGRASLTEDEDLQLEQARARLAASKKDIVGIERRLAEAREADQEEREIAKAQTERIVDPKTTTAVKPAYDRVARVGQEQRTYHAGFDRRGKQFLWDVVRGTLFNDFEANNRLNRHMHEERVERPQYLERAVGTGAFTGLVVPQYLTDLYAPATAALRPFADICNKHDLPPDGMTVNISRITTATSAAIQSSENSAVSETNADDTLLTENVQTAAGQQTVSRQAVERGTGIDDVLFDDLFRRYATVLDSTLINQATTGLTNVATGTTYDDTTPTAAELYPKILGSTSGVEAALLAQATPTHAIMHSRRWYWLASQMTSTWPFINSAGIPTQAAGTAADVGYNKGIRGILPIGLSVVVDNNIAINLGTATSQDEIYVVPAAECHLWEDPAAPVFIRAEQAAAATLGILMVLYGYFAYSLRRYSNGMGKVAGTGLTTPTF